MDKSRTVTVTYFLYDNFLFNIQSQMSYAFGLMLVSVVQELFYTIYLHTSYPAVVSLALGAFNLLLLWCTLPKSLICCYLIEYIVLKAVYILNVQHNFRSNTFTHTKGHFGPVGQNELVLDIMLFYKVCSSYQYLPNEPTYKSLLQFWLFP